jgi:DNA-binding transcriptional regulator YiaG
MTRAAVSQKMRETLWDLAQGKQPEKVRHLTMKLYVLPATADEVKGVRKHLGYSQQHFADWLGVSLQAVQAWEQGRRSPEVVTSKVIRMALQDKGFAAAFARPVLAGGGAK